MPIYKYTKAPIKFKPLDEADYVEIKPKNKEKLTVGKFFGDIFGVFNDLIVSSRIVGFFLPLILIVGGFLIIYNQVWPEVDQTLKQWAGYYDTESVSLVAGNYVERVRYISNPGAGYFQDLETQVHDATEGSLNDEVSLNYSGKFKISIESLGLKNLVVTSNVDSTNGDGYLKILDKTLAHFKGTGLPISNQNNNIVIYGHSASGDYYQRSKDMSVAFSELNKIKIGDRIKIEMDGKVFEFKVVKSKIVDPTDISIIGGTKGKRTLTLFTCFPNGNNAQRFVVVANPV